MRKTTASDLCLIEIGLPSLKERVQEQQRRANNKVIQAREGMRDDPFMFVWSLVSAANTPWVKFVNRLRDFDLEVRCIAA